MFKKIATLSVLTLALATGPSQAIMLPVTDIANRMQDIYEDMMKMLDFSELTEMINSGMDMMSDNSASYVDAVNNGSANTIARLNKAAADIFNLQQKENATAAPGSCDFISYGMNTEDNLCAENSFSERAGEEMRNIYDDPTLTGSMVADNSTGIGASTLAAASDSSSSSGGTSARNQAFVKAIKDYDAAQLAAIRSLHEYEEGEFKSAVTDPSLYMVTDSSPFQLEPEEVDIAKKRIQLEYPPYINLEGRAPDTEKEAMRRLRAKKMIDESSQIMLKQLAMKTPPEEGKPSRLASMQFATKVKFTDKGDVDKTTGESWMQTMMMKNPGDGANAREKMIMKSIELNQTIESYKQTLALEYAITKLAMSKLDKPIK